MYRRQLNNDTTDVSAANESIPTDVSGTSDAQKIADTKNTEDGISESAASSNKSTTEESKSEDTATADDHQKESDSPFQGAPSFPRFREMRPPFVGRLSGPGRGPPSLLSHFGPNTPPGPFPGLPNFQRARFLGHRPHPPFFQGSARHFSPFSDSRPPRPFASSRSNNFL